MYIPDLYEFKCMYPILKMAEKHIDNSTVYAAYSMSYQWPRNGCAGVAMATTAAMAAEGGGVTAEIR